MKIGHRRWKVFCYLKKVVNLGPDIAEVSRKLAERGQH